MSVKKVVCVCHFGLLIDRVCTVNYYYYYYFDATLIDRFFDLNLKTRSQSDSHAKKKKKATLKAVRKKLLNLQ